jgi:hypothetical protein
MTQSVILSEAVSGVPAPWWPMICSWTLALSQGNPPKPQASAMCALASWPVVFAEFFRLKDMPALGIVD